MKKRKYMMSFITAVCVMLSLTTAVMPVSALTGIGTVYEPYVDLLVPENITDGADNVVVNADGSWTVTGEFTLAVDVCYDYELVAYQWVLDAATDVECEVELSLYTTPDNGYTTGYFEQAIGPHMWAGYDDWISLSVAGVYKWMTGSQWVDDDATFVTCPTVTYRPYGEGTTVLREFYLGTGTSPYNRILGDIDDSKDINMRDVAMLYSRASGEQEVVEKIALLDMNDDTVFDMSDVMALYSYVSGRG